MLTLRVKMTTDVYFMLGSVVKKKGAVEKNISTMDVKIKT